MTAITTLAEARSTDQRHYFTGKPCKRGHVVKRFVSTRQCMECCRQASARWARENPEENRLRSATPEHRKAGARWHKEHPERSRSNSVHWKRENPDRRAAHTGASGVIRRGGSITPNYTTLDCLPFYAEARRLTRETGIPHEVDHIIPIALGGEHTASNLQVLTRLDNRQKGGRPCAPSLE